MKHPGLESLAGEAGLLEDEQGRHLLAIISEPTFLMPSGYPYISEAAFLRFIQTVPHLFSDGLQVLRWLASVSPLLEQLPEEQAASTQRAVRVLSTVLKTAAITAPSDLWLLQCVLAVHKRLGIIDDLLQEVVVDPDSYASRRGFNRRHLKIDLHFLAARGYLEFEPPCFLAPLSPQIRGNLKALSAQVPPTGMAARWATYFAGDFSEEAALSDWLKLTALSTRTRPAWVPTLREIGLGYRLVPVILGLATVGQAQSMKAGCQPGELLERYPSALERLFQETGISHEGKITTLGERVFQRGPGPFGIIGAYHPYLENLEQSLTAKTRSVWVNRAKNVVASQSANARTFRMANRALDAFCQDQEFQYTVFIEHAVGRGEATRQRFEASGEEEIRYFGADLEDAAIEQAVEQQKLGRLPQNMQFIRRADIGVPQKVLDHLRGEGLSTTDAVMLVGNGFHEIRNQTNPGMVETFRAYEQAGVVLLFTEETGLTNADLRATAWNTYHAGFRYVHELSGQGLRPSWDREFMQKVWSWRRCAQEAGYKILERYTMGTRPIYPIKKKGRENPSISVTYFCVPGDLFARLRTPG